MLKTLLRLKTCSCGCSGTMRTVVTRCPPPRWSAQDLPQAQVGLTLCSCTSCVAATFLCQMSTCSTPNIMRWQIAGTSSGLCEHLHT